MKKETIKKKTDKNIINKVKKAAVKEKTTKKSKPSVKKPVGHGKKTSNSEKKMTTKNLEIKKTAKESQKNKKNYKAKPVSKPVRNNLKKKQILTQSKIKPSVKKTGKNLDTPEKNSDSGIKQPNEQQNMSLPEGSAFKQTGHRRPLIVFPK
ncbi:MAG: hypothetical protein FWC06_03170 [Treponema sp.]|nr:hypothetical protein [Treponema sp.]